MEDHKARYKLLKLQPNESCKSGVFLSSECSTLFSEKNIVEVNKGGINLQPAYDKGVALNTFTIKGPLYRQSMPPSDFIPGLFNITSRKTLDVPFETEVANMKSTLFSLLSYLA